MSTTRNIPPSMVWEPESFETRPPINWTTITDRITAWALVTATMGMMLLVGFILGVNYEPPKPQVTITTPAVTP